MLVSLAIATANQPPNIVFVLADDLGYNDVSYHGSEIQTPNLDKLAIEGVRLENYYVQQVCSPTRSQLLSGRYQIHTGLQHSYIGVAQPNCLPTEIPILPQWLKNVGYATHMVGKWHLGFYKKACLPQNRGFDSFFGYHSGSEDYYTHFRGGYGVSFDDRDHWLGYDFWDNDVPFWSAISNYSVFVFNDRVNQVIDKHNKSKPLFLYLPFQSVHSPLQVPKQYQEPYKNITNNNRRIYAGMTSCMDEAIGNVVEKLKTADLWNNTVFVFSTDNGGQILEGGNNWPLRGWKASYWEGGLRGVGFVHSDLLPSDVRGTINKQLIHVSDWLPTLVNGVAGYPLNYTNLDGFNMWDIINSNKTSPRKELLHNIDPWPYQPKDFNTNMTSAIRVGDWKLLTGTPGANNGQWIAPPGSGITPHLPLTIPGQNVWLFNITADPYEEMELSEKYPTVVKTLLAKLDTYYKDSVPVRYPDDSDQANPALHNGTWAPWE
ncbi:putative arylsulfatase J [Apostichopus japonicus]|uniref:Putative arylsulfatase J n=1 Tax=Stichopus japonicus TaxID=307972 RepID=A0A2G8KZM5_STIJA|nr:putative arylsulfatase J [Apostichopus japonicus]